jgi:hypothetical protein
MEELEKDIASSYPDIEILVSSVKTLHFPDFVLYNEVKELYRDYLAAQRTGLKQSVGQMSIENLQNRRRFDELQSYGELLTKYPVLVQYLAIEKGIAPKTEQ